MIPISKPNRRHRFILPWQIELTPWPFWDQLRDPMPPGIPNTNDANDCGPESVAMCLRYLTGVSLQADYIKDVIKGANYVGYTGVPDLEAFLRNECETRAETILTTSAANQAWWEWRYLRQGKPLIGLFYGSAPGANDGHFRAVIGQTHTTAVTADPWTGQRRVETLAEHWAWSKGLLIGVDRKRKLGDH
ncbi:MAG TPA: papain-like cysteine protease family protein [Chloroflexota bacterium]|jgi:hypothetical protein|nr:papain-like cysteine protease family protein [Chloroflexota bacterium]